MQDVAVRTEKFDMFFTMFYYSLYLQICIVSRFELDAEQMIVHFSTVYLSIRCRYLGSNKKPFYTEFSYKSRKPFQLNVNKTVFFSFLSVQDIYEKIFDGCKKLERGRGQLCYQRSIALLKPLSWHSRLRFLPLV